MKNLFKISLIAGLLALLAASPSLAQSTHYNGTDDTAIALRVYNTATGTATVAILGSGTQAVVTVDGLATTITGTGDADTIAELAAAIAACTNRDGAVKLTVDQSQAISTDSTDAELLTGVYTAAPNTWVTIPWDTSACKFYQATIPARGLWVDADGDAINADRWLASKGVINRVYGLPTGTGNATLKVYVNGTERLSNVYAEPYVLGVGNTNVIDNVIRLNEAVAIDFGFQDSVIVRASRATTAAGGNIGFSVTPSP